MNDGIKPIIRHDQYEKIVDDLFIIGNNVILRFNTILSKYSNRFGRVNYHQEFEYYNRDAGCNTITMRRDFDFYLSIENMRSDENTPIKQFIMITVSEIYGFRLFLDDVMRWFDDPRYDGLYVTDSKIGELVMTRAIKPISISLPPNRSYIAAEPMVCVNRFNEESQGVRLYLSSDTNYVEVTLHKMRGFKYLIDSIDMYGSACALINYKQRPELGTNLISYSYNKDYNVESSVPTQTSGRKIQPKKAPSLDDLEK